MRVTYTRFPLPALLCAGYIVKLIKIKNLNIFFIVPRRRTWELSVNTLGSPLGHVCFPLFAEYLRVCALDDVSQHRALPRHQSKENKYITYFIPPCWNLTHNRCVYSCTPVPLRHSGLKWKKNTNILSFSI